MTGRDLRILMTVDAIGGVWQYATDLAAELVRFGNDMLLAVLGPTPSAAQLQGAEAAGIRIAETGLALDWLAEDAAPVREAAERIAALAALHRADVIHCNSPALAGAAHFGIPTLTVAHGCVTTWWQAARDEPLPPAYHWHRDLVSRGLRAAERVAAPSHSYARLLQQTYGLRSIPNVIHNGRKASAAAGANNDMARHALTVGRLWDDVKGARILDDAAALIDVPFLAAGAVQGPQGQLFAASHLRLLGQLGDHDLAEQLAARPVFVSAATFEPFGLSVLEAAQAGCALILSDIEIFRELWEGAAIFVDPSDSAQFAETLSLLMSDDARRAELGRAAGERARRFTVERMARDTAALYASLCGARQAA